MLLSGKFSVQQSGSVKNFILRIEFMTNDTLLLSTEENYL
jgi:hypothetical protein